MNNDKEPSREHHKPVAYDAQGNPLYTHPAGTVVHVARSLEPERPILSNEVILKHDRSRELYPTLNLSAGEYVISAVKRHPIGIAVPLAGGTIVMGLLLAILLNYQDFVNTFSIVGPLSEISAVALPIILFVVLIGFVMFITYYVYTNNRFFLTNESVIQEIQVSLFSKREQTVSLGNIEDASYTQRGIIQQLFDYGDIRLSTEGDETTYRFSFVAGPKNHIAKLNNAVEAFKNGLPIEED